MIYREPVNRQEYELIEVCSESSTIASGPRDPSCLVLDLIEQGKVDVWQQRISTATLPARLYATHITPDHMKFVREQRLDTDGATSMVTGRSLSASVVFESSHKAERVIGAQKAEAIKSELLARSPLQGTRTHPYEEASHPCSVLHPRRARNIEAAWGFLPLQGLSLIHI